MKFIDHAPEDVELSKFYHIVDIFCQQNITANSTVRQLWPILGEAKLLGLTTPTVFTGQDLTLTHQLIAMTIISSYNPSIGLSYGAHSNLCVHQLQKHATKEQKLKFLPKLIDGTHIGALAMSEVNAGSDALNLQLEAKKKDNGAYVLTGSKMWITNGPIADVVIVYARTGTKISAFIVDKTCKNWHHAQVINKLGMQSSPTSELVFNDCEVPAANILGQINQGTHILMDGLNTERLILTGGPLGIMQRCLNLMHKYMNMRYQFQTNIGSFQLMQAKIANAYAQFAACSAWAFNLAQTAENINRFDASALILLASESASKIASETVQTYGGNGYSEDYEAAGLMRDAKLYEIGAGTNEIRRMLVGKYLLEQKYDY